MFNEGCDQSQPSGYTRVSAFLPWIKEHTIINQTLIDAKDNITATWRYLDATTETKKEKKIIQTKVPTEGEAEE